MCGTGAIGPVRPQEQVDHGASSGSVPLYEIVTQLDPLWGVDKTRMSLLPCATPVQEWTFLLENGRHRGGSDEKCFLCFSWPSKILHCWLLV